jgi:hypothetical protein
MDNHPQDCDCPDCRYLAGEDSTDDGEDDDWDEDEAWTSR